MPYLQTQVIADTDRRFVIKRVNTANNEANVVVVNCAALKYALSTLTTAASANNFKTGELVNAASGGSGFVQDTINSTTVILHSANGTFSTSTTITGAESGKTRVQSGSLTPHTKRVSLEAVRHNIASPAATAYGKVELVWEGQGGGGNNAVAVVLAGSGDFSLSSWGAKANNNATSPTGNLLLNVLDWSANSHYTLIIEVNKELGFAMPNFDKTRGWGE